MNAMRLSKLLVAAGLIGFTATVIAPDFAAASAIEQVADRVSFAPMLARAMPAVVSIGIKGFVRGVEHPLLDHPLYGKALREDLGEKEPEEFVPKGAGVIIDAARGLLVTNFHVIEQAKAIQVRLHDGREYLGEFVGGDPATDVALLRITAEQLVALPFGNSRDARVGDVVIAIGTPLGLEATATMGMVSAVRRTTVGYRSFEGYIQHDASVNSGSSGGPLINLNGEIIGINTAILSPTAGNVGLGFALPSGIARRISAQLDKYGKVRRGQIGLRVEDAGRDMARKGVLSATKGAVVKRVQSASPADKAGLHNGDIVVGVALKAPTQITLPITNAAQLDTLVAVHEIGDELSLDILRGEERIRAVVAIVDLQPDPERLTIPAKVVRMAGVVIETLEIDDAMFGKVKGVEVSNVPTKSLADFIGLRNGDIITGVDKDKVRKPDDLLRLLKDHHGKFELHIVREGVPMSLMFPV